VTFWPEWAWPSYRHWSEAIVVPPLYEPVTLKQIKDRLRIVHTADDDDLKMLAAAARRQVELDTSAVMVQTTLEQTVPAPPVGAADLLLMRWPVQEILSVTAYGTDDAGTVIPATGYRLNTAERPARVELLAGVAWPKTRVQNALTVRYVAGFGAAPFLLTSLVTDQQAGTVTAVTTAPHDYADNDRVTIVKASPEWFNGTFRITVVNPTTFTYERPPNATGNAPAKGTIYAVKLLVPEDFTLAILSLAQHWWDPLRSGLTTDGEQVPLPYGYDYLTRDRLEWMP